MKKLTLLLIGALCAPLLLFSQEEESTDYSMVELTYMKPKVGMEKKFVEAVKKHNEKYHAEEPYESSLFYISTGNEAGWFVWAMGTLTYTDLDGAPGEGAHMDDWRNSVGPHVAEYGRVEYWRHSDKFSVPDGDSEPLEELWFVDVERGEYYRFKAFMEKIKVIHEKMEEEIHVWTNNFHQGDGRDVAISWPFDKWAEYDEDDWNMKEEFDKEYGEGSWDDALEEWEDFVTDISQEIWRTVL